MDWSEFKDLCGGLSFKVKTSPFTGVGCLRSLFGIPRGGCFVAMELSHLLQLPIVDSPFLDSLVVDDIVDSGITLKKYSNYISAALVVKPHSLIFPNFHAIVTDQWVKFPWEVQNDETIEDNIVRILEYIGENPNRPGLKDTPKRIVKMYSEIFKGYDPKMKPKITAFENELDGVSYDQMVFDAGHFSSFCEHHCLPFLGSYSIGYIPGKKVCGLSKFSRIVDYFGSKLQIQERLVKEIADELEKVLEPRGLGVMLKASHLCKEIRGAKNKGFMVTSDLRGVFRSDQKVRDEFLALVAISKV